MIVYRATRSRFVDDANTDDIEEIVRQLFKAVVGRNPPGSEVRSWRESLREMSKVLGDEAIPKDAGVVVRDGTQRGHEHFEAFSMETLTPIAERNAFAAVWALIQSRPDAVTSVYSAYEKTQYRKFAARYPDVCAVEDVEALFGPGGRVIDVCYGVVRPSTEWARTGNAAVKQRILDYNEDDCVAMRVLLEGIKKLPVRPE